MVCSDRVHGCCVAFLQRLNYMSENTKDVEEKMTLDKDDLFRNYMPGFVFMIVVLSFKIISRDFYDLNGTSKLLLLIAAVFPIGFIIQTIHRFVFHIACCEQKTMRKDEYGLLEDNSKLKNKITKNFEKVGGEDWDKFAQLVAFSLDKKDNECFKIRINFLNSYFHALGASALAVGMAIFVILATCFLKFICSAESFCVCLYDDSKWKTIFWLIPWVVILVIFWDGRREIIKEYRLCRKLFIQENWPIICDTDIAATDAENKKSTIEQPARHDTG